MSEINLKPCPFCGGEAELLIVPGKMAKWEVRCMKCYANNGTFVSDHDAVEAWDKRAEPELPSAQPEIVRCKDCAAYGEMLTERDTRMICHKFALNFPRDFYCADAERRTDE